MKLVAAELRLLRAARKIFETGETLKLPVFSDPIEGHDISLFTALEECEKYFRGSSASYRVAKERVLRKLWELEDGQRGFWGRSFLHGIGYSVEVYRQTSAGCGVIEPGNVSRETFNNWCVLATMAYLDRMIETGEIK